MLRWNQCRPRTRTRCTAGAMPAASTAAKATRIKTSRTAHSSTRTMPKATTTPTLRAKNGRSRSGGCSRGTKAMFKPCRSAEVLPDRCFDLAARHGAHHAPALHSVLEQHEQRDAPCVELRGQAREVV